MQLEPSLMLMSLSCHLLILIMSGHLSQHLHLSGAEHQLIANIYPKQVRTWFMCRTVEKLNFFEIIMFGGLEVRTRLGLGLVLGILLLGTPSRYYFM